MAQKKSVVGAFADGLTNLVANLGTSRDKAAHSVYGYVTLSDQEISAAYRSSWIPRKIVDIPALDSCRAWRDWQATTDQIEKIEAEEKRLGLRGKALEARTQARLWGGAAILIGTGEDDQSKPLDVNRIGAGGIQYLTVLSRHKLNAGEIEDDPASDLFDKPKSYTLGTGKNPVEIHASRLVIFNGDKSPDDYQAVNTGWGDSVLIPIMSAIKNADATAANIASLVFEAKVDVIKIPDFMAHLSDPDYERRFMQRGTLAAMGKGNNGQLWLDSNEDYQSKSASFSTLPEILDRFLTIVAGAADIPATRLLGQSPAGLSATGESDIRNYYDRISAAQELEMTPAMQALDECLIRSALGARPPEIFYTWSPLWQISAKERADIGKINADTIKALNDTGLFPPEALAKSGANMLIENSILPGFDAAIEDAGGLPDYEFEAEQEREAEAARLEAMKAAQAEGDEPDADADL